jgi:hypothetical protein
VQWREPKQRSAFDQHDRLYVLELYDAPGFPNPGDGKSVRVSPSGEAENIVTGLVVPTAITFGPDGALYVSNFGAAPPGLGQFLRVDITSPLPHPVWIARKPGFSEHNQFGSVRGGFGNLLASLVDAFLAVQIDRRRLDYGYLDAVPATQNFLLRFHPFVVTCV